MQLSAISYREYPQNPREWKLKKLSFGDVNLLVGRNATGKTRSLNIINALSNLLAGQARQPSNGEWTAEFVDQNDLYIYKLKIKEFSVAFEKLERIRNGKKQVLLTRTKSGAGKIYHERTKRLSDFQSPPDQIAAVARRDKIQHSYFIPLVNWGKNTFHFSFGRNLGYALVVESDSAQKSEFNPKDTSQVIDTFRRGEQEFGKKFINLILSDMARIDYRIQNIGIDLPKGIKVSGPLPGKLRALFLKEEDLKCNTEQISISAGMFAALSVIVHVNYRIMSMEPSCFIIDDIGEGLDYERSCSLIDLLIEKSKGSSFQLLLATNDRFVMNAVPLDMWTVLKRDGSVVSGLNIRNAKSKFDAFRFTGLNNFDLFATDYLYTSKQ
ncbi:MAG: ATP-binding protein [Proteobacteria bacterium]|nr:ATP-binding protein [Pseudomonadota bacterium]